MNRSAMNKLFGVTVSLTCMIIARPASVSAQFLTPAAAPVPAPPRGDTVALQPLRVTTPPPSSVRPTGIRASIRSAQPAGPVAMMSPSPEPSTLRQGLTVIPGPPTPPPLARLVPSPIAASAITPAQRIASADPAPPPGATMRCKDGTFLTGVASEQRCAGNGGLGVSFPAPVETPRPPLRRP